MKYITPALIYLIIITFSISVQSQEKELFLTYNYTTKNQELLKQSFEIMVNKHTSICTLKTTLQANPKTTISDKQLKLPESIIFKNYRGLYLISQENIYGKDFYTKEPLNQMQWQLTGNTKTVLKYSCQEATTSFRGRDYIAYFTTELPFKAAPYKFYGLPGVVLQVQTKDKLVNIEATSLKIQPSNKDLDNPFKNKETMSWDEFVIIYKKKNKLYNEKLKLSNQYNFKKAKELGIKISKTTFNHNVAEESRLDIIVPGNDLSYALKQIKKSLQNGN
jgi:GLPGLI family protein